MTSTDGHVHDAGRPATALYEVVVVSYRSRRPLTQLLASLPADIPLTLVDNSADQDSVRDLLEARPAARYIDAGGNVGFAAAANLGARASTRPYVIFVNPDCTPTLDVLAQLVDYLERHPRCASTAPALMDGQSRPQIGAAGWQPTLRRALIHAIGLHLWWPHQGIWGRARSDEVLKVGWLPGTCLAVGREVFLEVGGFDERYFLYSEDMALGARLQACGHTQVLRGDLQVTHTGGGSSEVEARALWHQRGRALADYVTDLHPASEARLIRLVLILGYLLRWALYQLSGRRKRASEMLDYVRGLLARQGSGASGWDANDSGAFVVVVGPDGAGKTTVARALMAAFGGPTAYFHFRPALGRPLASRPPDNDPVLTDKGVPGGTRLLGWARLVRSITLFWVAYLTLVRPALRKGKLVVGDRWGYGYLIQPHALRFYGPKALARLAVALLPRPHLVVNLAAPAKLIAGRKQELTLEQIRAELDDWRRLPVGRLQTLDASLPPEEIAAAALAILSDEQERFRHKSRPRVAEGGHLDMPPAIANNDYNQRSRMPDVGLARRWMKLAVKNPRESSGSPRAQDARSSALAKRARGTASHHE